MTVTQETLAMLAFHEASAVTGRRLTRQETTEARYQLVFDAETVEEHESALKVLRLQAAGETKRALDNARCLSDVRALLAAYVVPRLPPEVDHYAARQLMMSLTGWKQIRSFLEMSNVWISDHPAGDHIFLHFDDEGIRMHAVSPCLVWDHPEFRVIAHVTPGTGEATVGSWIPACNGKGRWVDWVGDGKLECKCYGKQECEWKQ